MVRATSVRPFALLLAAVSAKTLETQVKAIFDAAQKKALASGGGSEANVRAIAEAAKKAVTMLAIELDRLRSREAQPK
jgi:hypothetical protein